MWSPGRQYLAVVTNKELDHNAQTAEKWIVLANVSIHVYMADTDTIFLCMQWSSWVYIKNTLAIYDQFFNRSFDIKLQPH